MIRLTAILCAVLAIVLFPAAHAQEDGPLDPSVADGIPGAKVTDPFGTIVDFVAASGNHTVLTILLTAAGLDPILSDVNERITLLAPTDRAFANLVTRFTDEKTDSSDPQKLAEAVLDQLGSLSQKGLRSAESVLKYHALAGAFPYRRLRLDQRAETLAGPAVKVTSKGIEDRDNFETAGTNGRDFLTQNGWVHAISSVLIPFNLTKTLIRRRGGGSGTTQPPTTQQPTTLPPTTTLTPTTPGETTPVVVPPTPTEEATPKPTPPSESISPESSTPVPSPDEDDDDGVCFPATARVHVADGSSVEMWDLRAGTEVMHDEAGSSSKVFLFTHRKAEHTGRFVHVKTACRHAVTLTRNHYLYANGALTAASAVRVGDVMRTVDGPCAVSRVSVVSGKGLYAPHSMHGDLVVDGIVVSGYSRAVAPSIAHAMLLPVRWVARATGMVEPLGKAFYDGGDWALRFLPRGSDAY